MGLFWKKNRVLDPPGVAKQLYQSFVENGVQIGGDIAIPSSVESHYQAKVHCYRLAAAIGALLAQEENYPRVSEIRESLETFIFGKPYQELVHDGRVADDDKEKMALLNLFQMAMRSFGTLIAPENKLLGMRWAKEWLVDIGVEEHNPIRLQQFSWSWQLHYIAILETVDAVAMEHKL